MPPFASVDHERAPSAGRLRRTRLDTLLVERELAPSRERARALIMAGDVLVDGQRAAKPGMLLAPDARCELAAQASELRYVSRGGLKLEHALDCFALNATGRVALDVGASTGGFTDVLLRRGAKRVFAVDVGRGQLAWVLRTDPRVVVMEHTNIRHLAALPEPIDCAVVDVSFISLRLVLPVVARLLREEGWVVALIKPQFEAGRAAADRGAGVISDPSVHREVLRGVLDWLRARNGLADALRPLGLVASPIRGRDGNREYLLHLVRPADSSREREKAPDVWDTARIAAIVDAAFAQHAVPREQPCAT